MKSLRGRANHEYLVVVVGHEEVGPVPSGRVDERTDARDSWIGITADAEHRPTPSGYRQQPKLRLNTLNLDGCGEPSASPNVTQGMMEMFRDQIHTCPIGPDQIPGRT